MEEELLPKLWKGAVVVMDNLKAHKIKGITEIIESVGARVVYLSPYLPKFNPIEHLWWQLKAFMRKFSFFWGFLWQFFQITSLISLI